MWTAQGLYVPDTAPNNDPNAGVAAPFTPSTGTGPMATPTAATPTANTGTDYGFGPTSAAPQSDLSSTPTQGLKDSFMPDVFTAPFYNASAVAGNLGTMMTAGVAPAAAGFMEDQFSPNLTGMEQSFLGAGLNNASRLLEQGMTRQESQFEETPYHSGLARAQGDVMNQYANDLTSQAAQMGTQRAANAAQMSQFPFTYGLQASQVAPTMASQMYNMYNNAYSQPTQTPMSTYTQIPVPNSVISQSSGGGKLG